MFENGAQPRPGRKCPATRDVGHIPIDSTCNAQPRPGRKPRRHTPVEKSLLSSSRNTLNQGRGVNPGDTISGGLVSAESD